MTIDISVFTSRLILELMQILLSYDLNIRILYSEPAEYHPTKKEYEEEKEKWLADDEEGLDLGAGRIIPSMEAPGQHLDQLPDCLFLFAGFSSARTKAVRNEIDPNLVDDPAAEQLIWFIGEPREDRNKWRVEAVTQINDIQSSSQTHYVKTYDYRETMNKLESCYQEHWKENNISISNFGSKLQTFGISLFCYARPDVRAINVVPRRYNAKAYSYGMGQKWKIEFGSTLERRNALKSIGTLSAVTE